MFKVHLSRGEQECTQVWNREWNEFQTGELTIHYSKQQLGMNRILCCVENVGICHVKFHRWKSVEYFSSILHSQ